MGRSRAWALAVGALISVGGGSTASAEEAALEDRAPAIYIGASVGGNLVLTDWNTQEVDEDTGLFVSPDSGFVSRLRLGARLHDRVGVEIGGAWLPTTAAGDRAHVLGAHANILFHLMDGRFRPFLLAGAGWLQNTGDGDDGDPEGHFGVGVRYRVDRRLLLRTEARYVLTDGLTGVESDDIGMASLLQITVGVDFELWGKDVEVKAPPKEEVLKDSDGDGVFDAEDQCPEVAGSPDTGGCPDTDGDGVKDAEDDCPKQAGAMAFGGCPDTDGDGLQDSIDRCPEQAGDEAFQGCPDTDGDGLSDPDDKCPKIKGPKELSGCLDTDGDSVIDPEDKCPERQGEVARKGCPAPPKAVEKKFTGSIKGVYFKTGSSELTPRSNRLLDETARVLKEYANLNLRIEGHTDSSGDDDKNMALSQARADAVKSDLVSRGIAADRLEAVGLGETQPVGNNKTRRGRKKNRRIEFKLKQ